MSTEKSIALLHMLFSKFIPRTSGKVLEKANLYTFYITVYHLSGVVAICGVMVLSTVTVLILYSKSDEKHPMSTRVKKISAFLGRIVRYKVQAIPTRIEVKEFQCKEFGPKTNLDHSKKEQGTKPKDDAANPTTLRKYELCYCWKDVARILDRVFFHYLFNIRPAVECNSC